MENASPMLEQNSKSSVLDAVIEGAYSAIPVVTNVVVNVIAMVSFISLVSRCISWLGLRMGATIGSEPLTLEVSPFHFHIINLFSCP